MRIERFGTLDERLADSWQRAYAADPHAHVFMSWPWLSARVEAEPGERMILAVYEGAGGDPIAFLPLAVDAPAAVNGRGREVTLRPAGYPLADYAGLVCFPAHETEALRALGRYLRREVRWDRFALADVLDPRLERLAGSFSRLAFERIAGRTVACPSVRLPGDWDTFLRHAIRGRSRESLRRRIRKIQAWDGYRMTVASAADLDAHLDALLTLWQGRWGAQEASSIDRLRRLLSACHARGGLWLGGIWDDATPVAALAAYVEPIRSTFSYYISGFSQDYEKASPGRVMVALSIRAAIELGLCRYDFLRGGESYKYQFGAEDAFAREVILVRRTVRSSCRRMMRRVAGWTGATG